MEENIVQIATRWAVARLVETGARYYVTKNRIVDGRRVKNRGKKHRQFSVEKTTAAIYEYPRKVDGQIVKGDERAVVAEGFTYSKKSDARKRAESAFVE